MWSPSPTSHRAAASSSWLLSSPVLAGFATRLVLRQTSDVSIRRPPGGAIVTRKHTWELTRFAADPPLTAERTAPLDANRHVATWQPRRFRGRRRDVDTSRRCSRKCRDPQGKGAHGLDPGRLRGRAARGRRSLANCQVKDSRVHSLARRSCDIPIREHNEHDADGDRGKEHFTPAPSSRTKPRERKMVKGCWVYGVLFALKPEPYCIFVTVENLDAVARFQPCRAVRSGGNAYE